MSSPVADPVVTNGRVEDEDDPMQGPDAEEEKEGVATNAGVSDDSSDEEDEDEEEAKRIRDGFIVDEDEEEEEDDEEERRRRRKRRRRHRRRAYTLFHSVTTQYNLGSIQSVKKKRV